MNRECVPIDSARGGQILSYGGITNHLILAYAIK
jgi:hypothetical protein